MTDLTRTQSTAAGPSGPTAAGPTAESTAHRGPVLGALMLSMGLVAIDSTIVSTAIPHIVADLGGFAQFPWVFSIYLLTMAVTVPLYGKFADLIGRKPVLFLGIGIFLAGSVLSGASWNMLSLIAFRGLQGIGAGAVQPMTMTIIGDLYTVQERGRIQGYISSVWGISAVLGPTLGGLFVDYASWRWIFFVNVPVGAATYLMLGRHFHESVGERRHHRIDWGGAITLTIGCSLLILGLLEGGVQWTWLSAPSIVVFVLGAVLIGLFVRVEATAAEPVLPLWVFQRRTLVAGNLAALSVGALTLGLSSYVPTHIQLVLGVGAVLSGFTLAAMSAGWPLAAAVSGKVYGRLGFRDTALLGSVFAIGGAVLFAVLPEQSPLWRIAVASFVVGVGLGFSSTATVVAVQSVVGWNRRGVVTGANMFTRSIGSAVGIAVFGAIANSTITHRIAVAPAAIHHELTGINISQLTLGGANVHDPRAASYVRHALFLGVDHIYWALVVVAAAGAVFQAVMPRHTSELLFREDVR